jgi:UDPglucose--hexose-1-phosphate uridylyltransferase
VAEFRKDPLTGIWVVVGFKKTKTGEAGKCPFCPGNEAVTPPPIREICNKDGEWLVRCFPASNPVFRIEDSENKRAEGFYDKMGTFGAHEIVVENRSHTKTLSAFEPDELTRVVDMYTERIIDLKRDKRFKYVQVFQNHGEIAGSYIFHPHSHILATPIMPAQLSLETTNSRNHYLKKERCLLCDVVHQEIRQNKRIVSMTDHFIVICPFASRLSFEMTIIPRFHSANFEQWPSEEIKQDFVAVFLDTMKRLEKVASSYSIEIHTSPNTPEEAFAAEDLSGNDSVDDYFHWHIEILPRDMTTLKYKREDEFHTIFITPEEAALVLKTEKP